MFQLTREEFNSLKSQITNLRKNKRRNRKIMRERTRNLK